MTEKCDSIIIICASSSAEGSSSKLKSLRFSKRTKQQIFSLSNSPTSRAYRRQLRHYDQKKTSIFDLITFTFLRSSKKDVTNLQSLIHRGPIDRRIIPAGQRVLKKFTEPGQVLLHHQVAEREGLVAEHKQLLCSKVRCHTHTITINPDPGTENGV